MTGGELTELIRSCEGAGALTQRQVDMALGYALPATLVLAQEIIRLRERDNLRDLETAFAAGELNRPDAPDGVERDGRLS